MIITIFSDHTVANHSQPAISVIVPAFNASATLEETLTSILKQSFWNFEVLIVDDRSTDRTREIMDAFCARDPRVQLLANGSNQGVAASRNIALKEARADWIALIDADDLWHPSHLELLFDSISSSTETIGLISAAHRRIDIDSRVIYSATPWSVWGYALRQMIYHNFVGNGSAMLVKRAIAIEVGGFDERLREQGVEGCDDLLFQLHVAARYRVAAIPSYTVGYREVPGSISSDPDRMYRSAKLALKFFQDRYPGIQISRNVLHWHNASRSLIIARYKFRQGFPIKAAQLIIFAVFRDPVMTIIMLVHRGFDSVNRRAMRSSVKCRSLPPFAEISPRQGFSRGMSESSWTGRLISKIRDRRMKLVSQLDETEGPYLVEHIDHAAPKCACGTRATDICADTKKL